MSTTEVHDVLLAARALIAEPEHWCKGVEARDERGVEVAPTDPDAYEWCVIGALDAANGVVPNVTWDGWDRYCDAFSVLADLAQTRFQSLSDFNDAPSTTHTDILALFDKAIEAMRADA